jgi:BON domain
MQNSRARYVGWILALSLLQGGCNLGRYFQSTGTPDDTAITSAIEAKLFQDPTLKMEDIHVVCQKGVVLLTGTVEDDAEKSSAEQLASGVSGVKQVMNQLTVMAPPAASAAAETPASHASSAKQTARSPVRPARRAARRQPAEAAQEASESLAPAANPQQAETETGAEASPPPPEPVDITIPAGTVITVRTVDTIDSAKNRAGEDLAATVAAPVVEGGKVVIPQNSDARLRLVSVASAGHIRGQSEVKLELVSVSANGASYPVESSSYTRQGSSRGKRSAETIGGAAGLGALIGAIAGHGKGAAIGAAIGAGAGTAAQEATKGQQVVIPSETKIDFTLRRPLIVTIQP